MCQLGCQLGWGTSTLTLHSNYNINRPSWPKSPYNVNKIQYEPKVQKARLENEQKPGRAEQLLTKQMRFERRPEKTCHKNEKKKLEQPTLPDWMHGT